MSTANADCKQPAASLDELSTLCNQSDNGTQTETSSITPKVQTVGGRFQSQMDFYYQRLLQILHSKIYIWIVIVALCLCTLGFLGLGTHFFITNKIGMGLFSLTSMIGAAMCIPLEWYIGYGGKEKPIYNVWIANVAPWFISLAYFGLGIHFLIAQEVAIGLACWMATLLPILFVCVLASYRVSDGSRIEWPQHCGLTPCSIWNLVKTKGLRMIYPKKADTKVDLEALQMGLPFCKV